MDSWKKIRSIKHPWNPISCITIISHVWSLFFSYFLFLLSSCFKTKSSAKLKSKVSANTAEPRSENWTPVWFGRYPTQRAKRERESIILKHTVDGINSKHHLGCIKLVNTGINYHINWCRIFHQQYVGGGDLLVPQEDKKQCFFLLLEKKKSNKHDPEMFQRQNNAGFAGFAVIVMSSVFRKRLSNVISIYNRLSSGTRWNNINSITKYEYTVIQKYVIHVWFHLPSCVLYNCYIKKSHLSRHSEHLLSQIHKRNGPKSKDLAPKQNAWSSMVPHLLPEKKNTNMKTTTTTRRTQWWILWIFLIDFRHQKNDPLCSNPFCCPKHLVTGYLER